MKEKNEEKYLRISFPLFSRFLFRLWTFFRVQNANDADCSTEIPPTVKFLLLLDTQSCFHVIAVSAVIIVVVVVVFVRQPIDAPMMQ